MNEEQFPPPIDPELEARVVALVLGEASDFESEQLRRLIDEHPELAAFENQIRGVDQLLRDDFLRDELAAEGHSGQPDADGVEKDAWKLSSQKRRDLLAVIQADAPPIGSAQPAAPATEPSPTLPLRDLADQRRRQRRVFFRGLAKVAAVLCFVAFFGGLPVVYWLDTVILSARPERRVRTGESFGRQIGGPQLPASNSVDRWSRGLHSKAAGDVSVQLSDGAATASTDEEVFYSDAAGALEGFDQGVDPKSSLSGIRDSLSGGATLPSPYYLQDDVQYYPATPQFSVPAKPTAPRQGQVADNFSRPRPNLSGPEPTSQPQVANGTDAAAPASPRHEDESRALGMETATPQRGSVVSGFEDAAPAVVGDFAVASPIAASGSGEMRKSRQTAENPQPSNFSSWALQMPEPMRGEGQSQGSDEDQPQEPNVLLGGTTLDYSVALPSDVLSESIGGEGGAGDGATWYGVQPDQNASAGVAMDSIAMYGDGDLTDSDDDEFGGDMPGDDMSGGGLGGGGFGGVGGTKDNSSNGRRYAGGGRSEALTWDTKTQNEVSPMLEFRWREHAEGKQLAAPASPEKTPQPFGEEASDWEKSKQIARSAESLWVDGFAGERELSIPTEQPIAQTEKAKRKRAVNQKAKGLARPHLPESESELSELEENLSVLEQKVDDQSSPSPIAATAADHPFAGKSATAKDESGMEDERVSGIDADVQAPLGRFDRSQKELRDLSLQTSLYDLDVEYETAATETDDNGNLLSDLGDQIASVQPDSVSRFALSPSTVPESTRKPAPARRAMAPAGLDEKAAADEAFSTFSLHISDVSFKLARAALAGGNWPEAAKIRIEEFVNAFDYGDPMPARNERVACRIEQAVHPFLQQRNVLRVSMRTAAEGRSSATPLRLTLLLDNSGSMERHDRQQTVRRAFALLADQLGPIDQVTLISFARQPRLLADKVGGDKSAQLVQMVENLPSEGGTNLESALQLAYEKAHEQRLDNAQNRVILLTDGAVNLGDAEPENLSEMVVAMRNSGIAFDAAGISADGLNDEVLEALTRKGDGRYYLLDTVESADDGFARQVAGALRPSAKNVKVQIEFNPDRVGQYKLLGFEKHVLEKEDFLNDKVDAAEMTAAEAGVAMYQFEAKPDGVGDIGSVSVRFLDLSTGLMVLERWPIPYEPEAPRLEEASPSLRIATSAALLAAKLRGGALGETVDLKTLSRLVAGLPNRDRGAERVQQLNQMIEQARQVADQ